jgi:hypothetical protein
MPFDYLMQRLTLELTTMKQKCEGWREEVERLMPFEEEVKKLQRENKELGQQVTLLVEEGERKETLVASEGGQGGSNFMDYDTMMKRMTELQDTRITLEGELCQLREERAGILQENASLREGSQPQNYTNLKTRYESVVDVLHKTEVALSEEKKTNSELQSVNLELHQRLVTATDPEKLKSIQERMVRYKKERDVAKSEYEEAQSRLITAEISARDALLGSKEMEEMQLHLDLKETQIEKLTVDYETLHSRVIGYREERNRYREQARLLKRQLKETLNPVTPKLEGVDAEDDAEIEVSASPSHNYGSPTLDYMPEQYTSTEPSHYQHLRREDCNTPSDGASSPTTSITKHQAKMSMDAYSHVQAKPRGESVLTSRTALVKVKSGKYVEMDLQKPLAQLNPKQKPQVVVKRESGYETGTLMYVGRIGGKELAGVALDSRILSKYVETTLLSCLQKGKNCKCMETLYQG